MYVLQVTENLKSVTWLFLCFSLPSVCFIDVATAVEVPRRYGIFSMENIYILII
jgi:hypothetical protein